MYYEPGSVLKRDDISTRDVERSITPGVEQEENRYKVYTGLSHNITPIF